MMFGGTSSEITVGVAGADGDAPVDQTANRRRWYAIGGTTIAAVGFAACLTLINVGMRDVLKTSGGFCASGGAYVIAHQCASSDERDLLIGIVGILFFGGFFAGLTAWADGPLLSPSGLMWAALFGSLGWQFISPPKGAPNNLIVGVVFLLMALGGLYPAISSGWEWIKRGGEPEPDDPAFGGVPLVRATAHVETDVAPTTGAPAQQSPLVPKRLVIPPKEGA